MSVAVASAGVLPPSLLDQLDVVTVPSHSRMNDAAEEESISITVSVTLTITYPAREMRPE